MSGIYIPGMGLPEEGCHRVIKIFSDGTVVSYYDSETLGKAIPVPEHGRYIDADALAEMLEKYKKEYALKAKEDIVHLHKAWGLYEAELMAESLPTIIPASEDGNT